MGDKKIETPPVPGSWLMRSAAYVWYGGVMGLYLGPIPMTKEVLHKIPMPDYPSLPRRTEETVVLTGGTRGIGTEILKKLLQLDFTIIMGARSVEAGLKVVKDLREAHKIDSGRVKCFPLDLKSLKSVQSFGKSVLAETDKIHLLINNAGVMFNPWELTEDKMEVHFQVNYLSHFLLTEMLLPKMKETGNGKEKASRIVNVSSLAHYAAFAKYIQHCPNPKLYSPYKAYFESKLCQVLSTKYLDRELQKEGANVRVYAVHPGVIHTDLYSNLGLIGEGFKSIKNAFRSVEEGAEEIMFAALSPDLENKGGSYIQNTKVEKPNCDAEKEEVQKLLYDLSQDKINKFV